MNRSPPIYELGNAALEKCHKQGHWECAANVLSLFNSTLRRGLTSTDFHSTINTCIHSAQLEKARDLEWLARKSGYGIFSLRVKLNLQLGDFDRMLESMLQGHAAKIMFSRDLYFEATAALARVGKIDFVENMMGSLICLGDNENYRSIWLLMIQLWMSINDRLRAGQVLIEMLKQGFPPSALECRTLLGLPEKEKVTEEMLFSLNADGQLRTLPGLTAAVLCLGENDSEYVLSLLKENTSHALYGCPIATTEQWEKSPVQINETALEKGRNKTKNTYKDSTLVKSSVFKVKDFPDNSKRIMLYYMLNRVRAICPATAYEAWMEAQFSPETAVTVLFHDEIYNRLFPKRLNQQNFSLREAVRFALRLERPFQDVERTTEHMNMVMKLCLNMRNERAVLYVFRKMISGRCLPNVATVLDVLEMLKFEDKQTRPNLNMIIQIGVENARAIISSSAATSSSSSSSLLSTSSSSSSSEYVLPFVLPVTTRHDLSTDSPCFKNLPVRRLLSDAYIQVIRSIEKMNDMNAFGNLYPSNQNKYINLLDNAHDIFLGQKLLGVLPHNGVTKNLLGHFVKTIFHAQEKKGRVTATTMAPKHPIIGDSPEAQAAAATTTSSTTATTTAAAATVTTADATNAKVNVEDMCCKAVALAHSHMHEDRSFSH